MAAGAPLGVVALALLTAAARLVLELPVFGPLWQV
jgi:hypothetical protein